MFSEKKANSEKFFLYIKEKVEKEGLKYLKKRCEFIGEGSGRLVYRITPNQIVKIAKNQFGVEQNRVESSIYYSSPEKIKNILCPIFWISDDKKIMFMQYAEPLHKTLDSKRYDEFGIEALVSAKHRIVGLVDKTKEIKDLEKLFHLQVTDLCRASAWGIINNRKVIVDYGYDDELGDKMTYKLFEPIISLEGVL